MPPEFVRALTRNDAARELARAHYPFEWRVTDEGLKAVYLDPASGSEIWPTWAPQRGSQQAFLAAQNIFEVLYAGTRGPGKTDALLMDFAQGVGVGYGSEWRGILFRPTFPELADVINKSLKWFSILFPGASYNRAAHCWTFPGGEMLYFRHFRTPEDYWKYHGHAYTWIAWEELCNWPDDKCYKVMRSCCRSTTPGIPRCYRATTNPYGVGHNWVKRRWQLPQSFGKVIRTMDDDGNPEPPRVAIQGRLRENLILLHADPDYLQRLKGAARNPSELAAWVDGSWEITAGGMFDDIWRAKTHVVSFPIAKIPKTWKMDRSFDWGSSKPFAVCWWAESNGEPLVYGGRSYGTVRGDLFLIKEWYGWNGNRNEGVKMLASAIARGILERENDWGLEGRVLPGPADSSIFDDENGNSIERDMRLAGVRWKAADKSPGSRKQGWQQVRKFLEGAIPTVSGIREVPGLFVLDGCEQTLETVPPLPRDDKDLDDVNTDAEDHLGDAIRYRVRKKTREIKQTTGTR